MHSWGHCVFGCCPTLSSQGGQDIKLELSIDTLVLSDEVFVDFEPLNSSFKVVAFPYSFTGIRGKKKANPTTCTVAINCFAWSGFEV